MSTTERPIKVLLVEDNAGDARLLREMLREASGTSMTGVPFELEHADSLASGLQRMTAGGIDLVLLDLSLPDSHGFDTFNRTRAQAPEVPLIVMSGLADESLAIRTVQEGAQDYLVKGHVDPHLLVRAMLYAIERKRTEAQLALYTDELRRKNAQMEADLHMAGEMQKSLQPQQYPGFPGSAPLAESALRFCHRYHATDEVGGDFCQVLPLSDTQAGVFICDVMGHGVRAALVTAMVRALVEELKPLGVEPDRFLAEINQGLISILRPTRTPMFVSAFYLVADTATGVAYYANAGHPHPLHVRRRAGEVTTLQPPSCPPGPALGVFDESDYCAHEVTLAPDDLLLLFTDGLCEVLGPAGDYYDEDQMLAAVRRCMDLPMNQLFDELLSEIQEFSSGRDFEDDVCLLGMEVVRVG
jgi:sigma-B regulation protein RsbU (phosphoserine phosphatase)